MALPKLPKRRPGKVQGKLAFNTSAFQLPTSSLAAGELLGELLSSYMPMSSTGVHRLSVSLHMTSLA